MYRKYHTTESMIFTPWSKKVTPFPSLRCKIQAYQDNQRNEKVLQWGSTFQFSAPPVTQTKPRKRVPGKIRTRWSNKARYNPMKRKRPNTQDVPVTNMDMTDLDKMKVPLSVKVCNRFGLMCQFCKQSVQHPSPQESDWTNIRLGETQKPVGETNLLSDWNLPSPQYNPASKPEGIEKINKDKLSLDPNNPQEEPLQVTSSLIPPSTTDEEEKMDVGADNDQQDGKECEECQKIYVGQLSNEESDSSSDYSGFSYYN